MLFEAAVGGGIPLVRPLRESLLGEPIDQVMGIVNGTTNYILTRMTESGVTYAEALAEAQELGYAEADPTADVEGYDAGAKIAILASIAFGARVVAGDVYHEGISAITADDIAFAARNGFVVKLRRHRRAASTDGPELAVRVHPVMLPTTHPLASVRGSFNAVFVQGSAVGELMFYGRGAGGNPTASAVLGDLIDAALNLRKGSSASIGALGEVPIRPIDELESGVLRAPRRGRPARRAERGRRGVRRATACRSARWSRRVWATRPTWCSSPTPRSSATCRRRSASSATSTRSTRSAA